MAGTYDAIIIGGGHNGLVTACYLARARWKVLLLERRHLVGGACVTEELWPGYKVSTAAYVSSLFSPQILRDLKLADHGFALLERSPSSFTPFLDGRSLKMGPDHDMTLREIAKFSRKDAENYPKYEAMLERVAAVVEPTLHQTPPNLLKPGLRDLLNLFGTGRAFQKLGTGMGEAVEILTGPARPILDRWFESEQLKGTLATDAIIGAFDAPSMPGTAYVQGGMGGLTQSLAKVAAGLGVEIRTEAEVTRILVQDGEVAGVALKNGDVFRAKKVASGVDPHLTFEKMLEPAELPGDFLAAVKRISYASASCKINVALAEPPNWKALPSANGKPGPQHHGTMHIVPDQDYIERAYDDAKYGVPSKNPVIECTMASAVDPTVAPPGKHVLSMFVQYAPYALKEGNWDAERDTFADRCFDIVNEYAPNFKSAVLHRQVLTPVDLERVFNLTGGNIFQGAMSLDQLAPFRPVVGYANYRTPVRNLYLCGSAAHPGGGVMGIAGYNAAREMQNRW